MEKRSGSSDGNIVNEKSRRHRRKKMIESGENQDEGIDELNPDEYIREQQLKLDLEREQIMKNSTIIEEVFYLQQS